VRPNCLTLPYLFEVDATLRQHPALRQPDWPIAHPRKDKGHRNLRKALASFRSKGQRMLNNSL